LSIALSSRVFIIVKSSGFYNLLLNIKLTYLLTYYKAKSLHERPLVVFVIFSKRCEIETLLLQAAYRSAASNQSLCHISLCLRTAEI